MVGQTPGSLPVLAHPDLKTSLLFLIVPPHQIVRLQALFESYEGIGIVRTLDRPRCLVSILTTPDMESTAIELLESLASSIQWRYATDLTESEISEYVLTFNPQ